MPGIEGRAGMCGIVDTDGSLDLDELAKNLTKDLPTYARPVFMRVMTELEMTGQYLTISYYTHINTHAHAHTLYFLA